MSKDLSTIDLKHVLSVLIIEDSRFLFVKHRKAWPAGIWTLPGHSGKLDNLEPLIKKIKRDTGLLISIGGVIETYCAYNRPSDRLEMLTVFRGEIESGTINPTDSLQVKFLPIKAVLNLPVRKISYTAKMAIFDYLTKGVIKFSESPDNER